MWTQTLLPVLLLPVLLLGPCCLCSCSDPAPAPPEMAATDPWEVKAFLQELLREACRRLVLHLIKEASLSPGAQELLRQNAAHLLQVVRHLPAPRQALQVTPLLLEACGCDFDLLPQDAQQALADRLLQRLDPAHFRQVLWAAYQAVQKEGRLRALATEGGLQYHLHLLVKDLLEYRFVPQLCLRLHFEATLTDPAAAPAVTQAEVDMAVGESSSRIGVYLRSLLDPQTAQALRAGAAPLEAIWRAPQASAPGGVTTAKSNRACLLVLLQTQEEPQAVAALLEGHSIWGFSRDLYEEAWGLPHRELRVSFLTVQPHW